MEATIDRLIQEINTLQATDDFASVLGVSTPVKWDDPGLVLSDEYPYFFVAPVDDSPSSQTMGLRGYDIRDLTIRIALVVDQSDFFDPSVDEVPGSRVLVRAMSKVSRLLRRLSKSSLDGTVRNLRVDSISYMPDLREEVFVRMAVATLVVQKSYQHEE